MSQPETGIAAAQVYRELAPLAQDDEASGWQLLHFVQAVNSTLADVEFMARDTEDYPGWSRAVSLSQAPERILDWLAQLNGVKPIAGLDADTYRAYIFDAAGRRRGTLASLEAAGKLHLTGGKRIVINERKTSAYTIEVITYDAETPDPDQTYADLLTMKPAGLVLIHTVLTGQTWDELRDGSGGRTWDDVEAEYDDWTDVRDDLP